MSDRPIRVAVVDDEVKIQEYFCSVIDNEPDMEVVCRANRKAQAVEEILRERPDVVLMDIQMESVLSGIEAIRSIQEALPETKCIVLTIHEDDEYLFEAYTAGAMDYLTKTDSVVKILLSIRKAYTNQMDLRPEIADRILEEFTRLKSQQASLIYTFHLLSTLTNSEYEVLRAAYEGKSYKQIAHERVVEEATIKAQVNKILKKFEKKRLRQVIAQLKELKIFEQI